MIYAILTTITFAGIALGILGYISWVGRHSKTDAFISLVIGLIVLPLLGMIYVTEVTKFAPGWFS